MLQTLRDHHNEKFICPSPTFYCDLLWFIRFLESSNSVVGFHRDPVAHVVFEDTTLNQTGGIWHSCVYSVESLFDFQDV